MKNFAVISGNVVTNTIVADTLEDASAAGKCVEYTAETPAGIGWTYDENTGTFTAPVTEETNA